MFSIENALVSNWPWTVLAIIVFILIYKIVVLIRIDNVVVDLSETKIYRDLPRAINELNETPPTYPNGWIPLIELWRINTNQIENIRAFGYQLVVFRGTSNKIHVLDAYCPHLGANLGVGGEIVKVNGQDCIKCPFHGWQFRGEDGFCVKVPELEINEVPRAQAKVWKTIVVNNILFVWHHDQGLDPYWFPKDIKEIQDHTWRFEGRTEHVVNCHFQEIPENAPDMTHFAVLHGPTTLWGTFLDRITFNILGKFFFHGWVSEWYASEDPDEKHIGILKISVNYNIGSYKFFQFDFDVKQTGPTYVELKFKTTSFGGVTGVLLQLINPIAPNLNCVVHHIYADANFIGKLIGKLILYSTYKMLERDIIVWNNRTYPKNALFTKREHALLRFRRFFKQFYSNKYLDEIDDQVHMY